MSLQRPSLHSPDRPLVRELGVVVGVLVGLYLVQRATRALTDPLTAALGPSPMTMPLGGLATAALFVAGLVGVA